MGIYPLVCPDCGALALNPATRTGHRVLMSHDGSEYSVIVPLLRVMHCDHCGEDAHDEVAEQVLDTALRPAVGLLQPEQIQTQRERLGLKQVELAGLLGIAVSTLSRWETGVQMQQKAMDHLLRLFFDVPQCRQSFNAPEHCWLHEIASVGAMPGRQSGS